MGGRTSFIFRGIVYGVSGRRIYYAINVGDTKIHIRYDIKNNHNWFLDSRKYVVIIYVMLL